MADVVLDVKNLTKIFGSKSDQFLAVDNISFSVKEGEILGFLGPNGAGKTTTLQMLLGVLEPTSGEINYFGKNLKKHREEVLEKINFSSTYTNLPWNLTIKENLNFVSYLYSIKNRKEKINNLLEIFKLREIQNKQIHQLSAGQITRVNLAKAFLNSPKILLLDEPTASLDPDVALYIREFLLNERREFNVSIIITSHNMPEVEEVCERVIFINKGKIIADNTPDKLAKSIEVSHIELRVSNNLNKLKIFCDTKKIKYKIHADVYIIIDVAEKKVPEFLQAVSRIGVTYDEISIEKPSLEDYFVQVAAKKT